MYDLALHAASSEMFWVQTVFWWVLIGKIQRDRSERSTKTWDGQAKFPKAQFVNWAWVKNSVDRREVGPLLMFDNVELVTGSNSVQGQDLDESAERWQCQANINQSISKQTKHWQEGYGTQTAKWAWKATQAKQNAVVGNLEETDWWLASTAVNGWRGL